MSANPLTWEEAVLWLRSQPEQAALVHACFYDDPLQEAAHRYYNSTEWRAVRKFFPAKRGIALDLGAGRGISSYALARDGWRVSALEPDPSSVVGAGAIRALAREVALDISIEQEWGESLPYPDSTFDLVHARQVLHHAHDLMRLCAEAARVLKPGGVFIATREHVISSKEDLPAFLEAHPLHKLYGGENAYLLKEYTDAIQESGMHLVSVLNPLQSDINLFPDTTQNVRKSLSRRYRCPSILIPDMMLSRLGNKIRTPGMLYSFVAHKK